MSHEDDIVDDNASMILVVEERRSTLYHRCRQGIGKKGARCRQPAAARFLWPGATEWSMCCDGHLKGAETIAHTLGFRLQREPVGPIADKDEREQMRFDLLEVD